jgi:branched-chain amino acid transport system substrate-binding protein
LSEGKNLAARNISFVNTLIRPFAASAALLFALCATGAAAPAATPYTINVISPMTGSAAFLGKDYAETYHALEIAVNKSGGIKGRPVHFVLSDSQSTPQTGLQLVNGFIAQKAQVFIDGGPSTVCNSSIPIVAANGPVDYCLSPVIRPPSGSYVFSSGMPGADQAKIALRYLRQRGWTRIAELSSTDSTGSDLEKQVDAALQLPENKGLELVARDHYNPTDIGVAAQVARIKGSNPQALIVWATGTPFGTALHGLSDGGLDIPVVSTNSNMTYSQMTTFASYLPKGLYFPALLAMTPEATGNGPLHDAQVTYLKSFHAIGVKPDEGHILAWDPTMIIVSALRSIGPDATAQQIRDYILHLHGWIGVDGVYDFSLADQRGITDKSGAMARWDAKKNTWVRVSKPGGYL